MTYNYDVIHDGTYYRAGEEIPQSNSSDKEEVKKEATVKKPVRKKSTSDK